MSALIATDLDRTMIYSRHSLGARGEGADSDPGLLCVEIYQGKPLSYVSVEQARGLEWLAQHAVVVPTTTRTIEQFTRITLPGAPWRYAICSNGGNILRDGIPDERWRAAIDQAVDEVASLAEVSAELTRRIDTSWVASNRVADDLFSYLVVVPELMPTGFLAEWDDWCRQRGWAASQQGRKVYSMPVTVCKSRAMAQVYEWARADGSLPDGARVYAAGDGALDAEMLMAADAAIRPCHGELDKLDWHYPNLTVTERRGAQAGVEIVDWFADRVRADNAR